MAGIDDTTVSDKQVATKPGDFSSDSGQSLSQSVWDHIKHAAKSIVGKDDSSAEQKSGDGDKSGAKSLDLDTKGLYGDNKASAPPPADAGKDGSATTKPGDGKNGSGTQTAKVEGAKEEAKAGTSPAVETRPDAPATRADTPAPPASAGVDQAAAQTSAKQISDAMNWVRSDNYEDVQKALKGKSPAEIQAINQAFEKEHDGKSVDQYLTERWGKKHSEELNKVEPLLHPLAESAFKTPAAEYKGEGIKKDLPPGDFDSVGKGDKLEDIAKNKLGKDASADDVQKYVKELKAINHLDWETNNTDKQVMVNLPGHNANGDLVTLDPTGAKRSTGLDGSVKVESTDGTGYQVKPEATGGYSVTHSGPKPEDNYAYNKTPDGKGGYVEKHTGSRPEDNYEVSRTPDGSYKVKDAAGEKTADNFDKPQDPRIEKAHTLDQAESKMTDTGQLNRFRDDMESFENRSRRQNVSPEEQGKFYNSVSKLMEAGDNDDSKLSDSRRAALPKEADRLNIAAEIMTHGAHPDRIDQGCHGTCGVAALESQMFTKHPGAAADMIEKVATTGSFANTSPDTSLLKPDGEAKAGAVKDGQRDYASQLFQDTAISMIHGNYHRVEPVPGRGPPDSGDRFNAQDRDDNPGLTPGQIHELNNKIAGDSNPLTTIEHASQNPSDGHTHIKDQKDLEDQLSQLKGPPSHLPAVLFVNSKHEPFFTDSNGFEAGGSGGGHFVTVTDYHPPVVDKDGKVTEPAKVEIANQWGKSSNHKQVTTQELFESTKFEANDAQAVKDLQHVVAENRKNHQIDPVLEMELLRREKAAGTIKSASQYDKQLEDMMIAARKQWSQQRKNGTLDEDSKTRVEDSWEGLVSSLPKSRSEKIETLVNTKTVDDY